MKWVKLTEKTLKSLEVPEDSEIPFLVRNNKDAPYDEFAYDIVSFLDLSDFEKTDEEMKKCWTSILHAFPPTEGSSAKNLYEYTSEELLGFYTHYLWFEKGKK